MAAHQDPQTVARVRQELASAGVELTPDQARGWLEALPSLLARAFAAPEYTSGRSEDELDINVQIGALTSLLGLYPWLSPADALGLDPETLSRSLSLGVAISADAVVEVPKGALSEIAAAAALIPPIARYGISTNAVAHADEVAESLIRGAEQIGFDASTMYGLASMEEDDYLETVSVPGLQVYAWKRFFDTGTLEGQSLKSFCQAFQGEPGAAEALTDLMRDIYYVLDESLIGCYEDDEDDLGIWPDRDLVVDILRDELMERDIHLPDEAIEQWNQILPAVRTRAYSVIGPFDAMVAAAINAEMIAALQKSRPHWTPGHVGAVASDAELREVFADIMSEDWGLAPLPTRAKVDQPPEVPAEWAPLSVPRSLLDVITSTVAALPAFLRDGQEAVPDPELEDAIAHVVAGPSGVMLQVAIQQSVSGRERHGDAAPIPRRLVEALHQYFSPGSELRAVAAATLEGASDPTILPGLSAVDWWLTQCDDIHRGLAEVIDGS